MVEGFNGTSWIPIRTCNNFSKNGDTKIINATSNPSLPNNIIQFRFSYTRSKGTLAFDDVSIDNTGSAPSFISGYNNLEVNNASQAVTGLGVKVVSIF